MTDLVESETDVLVVGAGPTGLTMAIELRRRGVDCRLVERNDSSVETSRALGVQPRTLQVFEDMGVLDEVLDEGLRVGGATAYDGDRELFHLDLDTADLPAPYPFLWFLPQNRTERLLVERLDDLGRPVEFERELVGFGQDDDGVTATVRHRDSDTRETVRARWLVGCDGARSPVRTTLGLELEGTTEPQEILVADADLGWDRAATEGWIWFHEDGVVAALPMVDPGRWRLFVDVTSIPPERRPQPTREVFQSLLRERTSETRVTVEAAPWTSSFVTNQRLVPRYRSGRVFLAGDAAHVHNPLGGQGMNLGIQDAYNLAWKLALVHAGDASEALLDTYETERRPVAQATLDATGRSGSLLVTANPTVEQLRDRVLPRVVASSSVQSRMFRFISELGVEYRDSPLSRVHAESPLADLFDDGSVGGVVRRARRAWDAPKAGERALDGPCSDASGRETTLYCELHGPTGFALLVFAGSGPDDAAGTVDHLALARTVHERTGGLVDPYLVVTDATGLPATDDVRVLVDESGTLHERYDAGTSALSLLRPDDYVGFRSRPARLDPLLAYLDEWLVLPEDGEDTEDPTTTDTLSVGTGVH